MIEDGAGASGAAVVVALQGLADRDGIPTQCARLHALLLDSEPATGDVVCDVRGLVVDGVAVETLARLQLTARRSGRRLLLRHASEALQALLALMGLAEILPLEPIRSGQARRQTEEREQPFGIEEEGNAGDPPIA